MSPSGHPIFLLAGAAFFILQGSAPVGRLSSLPSSSEARDRVAPRIRERGYRICSDLTYLLCLFFRSQPQW